MKRISISVLLLFGMLLIGNLSIMASTASAENDEAVRPHAGMLRYPDVSQTHIVFMYANDLWLVPREGGTATPLAAPSGEELFPRFSPDGKTIAFIGNYNGDRDVYTLSVNGGIPQRVTHHPANEILCEWTPQDKILFFTNGFAGLSRQTQLFTVSPEGGMYDQLPVPYGANGAINTDGEWLAYTLHSRDFRNWKRYRGGMATDIWLFNLKNFSSKRITTWDGTDTYPMWYGNTVYYLSDAGTNHRLNIWAYDTVTEESRQITTFKEYDVKFPAIGPGSNGEGEIVFQNGSNLYLLNLSKEKAHSIMIFIPGAQPQLREKRVNVTNNIYGWGISPTAKRAVIETRGDIWSLPAKEGSVINLTRTDGFAERYPAWSPDGRWIAYFSDQSGEYELYIMQSDGKKDARQLTSGNKSWRFNPVWSPDSEHIAFTDKAGSLYIHTVESGESKFIDVDPWANRPHISWAHDSSWIAYTKNSENHLSSIWLYNLEKAESYKVTSDMFNDSSPVFDRKGEYLYFASNRYFSGPIYEDIGTTFVYTDTERLMAVPLRDDVKNPYAYESDEETWEEEKEEDKEKKQEKDDKSEDKDKEKSKKVKEEKADSNDEAKKEESDDEEEADKEKEKESLQIDIEGFEKRIFQLPLSNGGFYNLSVSHDNKLIYVRRPSKHEGGQTDIKIFDMNDDKKEEKTVLSGAGSYDISADGKNLLVRKGGTFAIIKAAPGQNMSDTISLSGMVASIEPRKEWHQIFTDVWRIQRDFFYDPNMHGVDWKAIYDHYEEMLNDCASREDVGFVISEMIAELNVGHTYYGGGDTEGQPSTSVGMLGVDFELENGAYRISKIYQGAPWDTDARSPLNRIKKEELEEGDYILAVNRVPLDTNQDPWSAFIGKAGQTVTLTVSDKPKLDDEARDVVVQLSGGEGNLRYRAWIESNRAYVDKKTNGKVGYIFVPNTSIGGQNDLFRQFYGQVDKEALIIDERWNAGGQIPTRFIELLNRPIVNYWARRDGKDWPWPPDAHQGPKCMLINSMAGSGGDAFPAYFRQAGLGKLIGTRTWGGLVGITGSPRLIDGAYTTAPSFAYYETDGTWGIEGHGVDPDIEVIDDPSLMVNGGDPQLDAAIDLMLQEIKSNPYSPPARPEYPDRSGMGITEEDK